MAPKGQRQVAFFSNQASRYAVSTACSTHRCDRYEKGRVLSMSRALNQASSFKLRTPPSTAVVNKHNSPSLACIGAALQFAANAITDMTLATAIPKRGLPPLPQYYSCLHVDSSFPKKRTRFFLFTAGTWPTGARYL